MSALCLAAASSSRHFISAICISISLASNAVVGSPGGCSLDLSAPSDILLWGGEVVFSSISFHLMYLEMTFVGPVECCNAEVFRRSLILY